MRLVLSDEPNIYGTVITSFGEIQVLLSESEEDIHIEKGGASMFDFFVFVPVTVYDQLVDIHSESVFQQALIRVCELLTPR